MFLKILLEKLKIRKDSSFYRQNIGDLFTKKKKNKKKNGLKRNQNI